MRCTVGFLLAALVGCTLFGGPSKGEPQAEPQVEKRLRDIRRLTAGGENAEAYFSADGKQLVFQSTRDGSACDQIYVMGIDGSGVQRVSTGKGRTTCSYFMPDGSRIVYASTHLGGDDCPPAPERRAGGRYVWPIYKSYDIFSAKPDGSDPKRLTETDGYDAEATISPDGQWIVFTSVRDGDLDLYVMKPDGSSVRRVTSEPGYDGGAFFSPDSKRLCFRASRPKSDPELEAYQKLLREELVEPSRLEIFVVNADGTGLKQVTRNGAANFCPFFHPSGKKLIYASNHLNPRGYNFDLFLVEVETGAEEQVTMDPTFDAFPMFSPDGKKLVWGSNRQPDPGHERDTNVFIADWVE